MVMVATKQHKECVYRQGIAGTIHIHMSVYHCDQVQALDLCSCLPCYHVLDLIDSKQLGGCSYKTSSRYAVVGC